MNNDRQFARFARMGGHIDGTVIELGEHTLLDAMTFHSVKAIYSRDVTFGDRDLCLPLPDGAMYVNDAFIEFIDDFSKREYATTNPYGKFIKESTTMLHDTIVKLSLHELCLQVSVLDNRNDGSQLIYGDNFYEPESIDEVQDFIADLDQRAYSGLSDARDDIIEELIDIKDFEEQLRNKRRYGKTT